MLVVVNRSELADLLVAALEQDLAGVGTLQDVVRWRGDEQAPWDLLEVVTQDEYTHDVIMRWRFGGFVVFDAT